MRTGAPGADGNDPAGMDYSVENFDKSPIEFSAWYLNL